MNIDKKFLNPYYFSGLLFAIGLCGIYIYSIIPNPYTALYPISLILATLSFYILVLWGREPEMKSEYIDAPYLSRLLLVFIGILFTISLHMFYSSGGVRGDENIHFYVAMLCFIFVYAMISNNRVSLLLIILGGLYGRLAGFSSSSIYTGVDIYSHSQWSAAIVEVGNMSVLDGTNYYFAPLYHILTSSTTLVTDITIKESIGFAIVVPSVIVPVLVLYSLASYHLSIRAGLISGFIFVISDYTIHWSIHAIPTTFSLILFSALILTVYHQLYSYGKKWFSILAIVAVSIAFSHHASFFITTTSIIISMGVYILLFGFKSKFLIPGLVFPIGLITHFLFSTHGGPSGERDFISFLLLRTMESLSNSGTGSRAGITLPQDGLFTPSGAAATGVLDVSGSSILITLGVCGTLLWLHNLTDTIENDTIENALLLSLSVTGGTLLIFALGGPVIGMRDLLPPRWFPYSYFFLSIPAAFTIISLYSIPTKYHKVLFIILLMVLVLPFTYLMVGSSTATPDQPHLDRSPGAERLSINYHEKSMLEHVSKFSGEDSGISTDSRYRSFYNRHYNGDLDVIEIEYREGDLYLMDNHQIILERQYWESGKAQYDLFYEGEVTRVHGQIPTREEKTAINKMYTTGNDKILFC